MQEVITLSLAPDVKDSIEARSKIESISPNELIERAVLDCLLAKSWNKEPIMT